MIGSRIAGRVLSRLPDLFVDALKARHYLRALKKQAPDQEREFVVIAKLVRPGDHVVDIGANYGAYTKLLSDLVGASGVVYSVEPVPATFKIIAANVHRLKLRNVRLLNCAFSDRSGEATMEIPRHAHGGENYYMAKLVAEPGEPDVRRITVELATMDSQATFLDAPIAFIKCDVEGHELHCISGAMQTLRRWKPAWCVEVSGDPDVHGSSAWRLFRTFEDESYTAYWFDGQVLRRRRARDDSVNYFFLQERHLEEATGLDVR